MLKLYYAPGTIARASHIALAESGADYEAIRLDFAAEQQRSADYLAINPKGRVPALVTEQGILSETPAILTYIALRFPQAGLAPAGDVFAFSALQSFMAYLASTMHVATALFRRGVRWASLESSFEDMRAKVPENTRAGCRLIEEDYFADGQWVMGAEYSVADPYLFTMSGWLNRFGIALEEFPNIAAHAAAMAQRPAVQRVIQEETR